MSVRRALLFVLAGTAGCAAPRLRVADPMPCPTASALATRRVAVLASALTSADSSARYYAEAMGVAGLARSDLVIETDAAVCTAVTRAIQTYLRGDPPTSNYLVIRAAARYIAIEPGGLSDALITVTTKFQDVRLSGGVVER